MTRPYPPPDRIEAVTWTATHGPSGCSLCGHQHWIWKSNLAQWMPLRWICERPNCDCPGQGEMAS